MGKTFNPAFPNPVEKFYKIWGVWIFTASTIYIVVCSYKAINEWPPIPGKGSLLLSCLLPFGLVVAYRLSTRSKTEPIPIETKWLFTLFLIGFLSTLFSVNILATLKSFILFLISGPCVFYSTKHLLDSKTNRTKFLWAMSLFIPALGCFGIYEFNANSNSPETIRLLSGNPLPAGALLVLLSSCPLILLVENKSLKEKVILSLCLISAITLIIFLSKKGPILGLFVSFIFVIVFINFRNILFLLLFFFLVVFVFYFSGSTLNKYKNLFGLTSTPFESADKSSSSIKMPNQPQEKIPFLDNYKFTKPSNFINSITLRLENYSFGLHVFMKSPFMGVGFNPDLSQYLDDYQLTFHENVISEKINRHEKAQKAHWAKIAQSLRKDSEKKYLNHYKGYLEYKKYIQEHKKYFQPIINQLKIYNYSFIILNRKDDITNFENKPEFNLPRDFTIECWFYTPLKSGEHKLFSHLGNGGYVGGYDKGNLFAFSRTQKGKNVGHVKAPVPPPNQWHHFAYVRSGPIYKLFIDGKEMDSVTETKIDNLTLDNLTKGIKSLTFPLTIGGEKEKHYWLGLIDEFHINSGKALYTTNFTPIRHHNIKNQMVEAKKFLRLEGPIKISEPSLSSPQPIRPQIEHILTRIEHQAINLEEVELKFRNNFKRQYRNYIKNTNTFENIIIAFFIQFGGIFSFIYFSGLIYLPIIYLKKACIFPQNNNAILFTTSILVGFVFISLTFDTLRFPNLNWAFHSLLGLMATLVSTDTR